MAYVRFCRTACLIIFFSVPALSSCRLKFPSTRESRELVAQGAFPGGAPRWIPAVRGERSARRASGFVPESYSSPRAESEKRGLSATRDLGFADDRQADTLARNAAAAEVDAAPSASLSPLERIAQVCAGLDSQVNAALTTTNMSERIEKYRSLVNRCPNSADLWFWLGRDYYRQNNLAQAGRCLEQALVLNSGNTEARNMLAEVRRQQNTASHTAPPIPSDF